MAGTAPTIKARLLDYAYGVVAHVEQFANAPLDAIALAVGGASYLLGPEGEDALATLNARRIGLVSPYSEALTDKNVRYWHARGFEVAQVVSASEDSAAADTPTKDAGRFHSTYALSHDSAAAGVRKFAAQALDAIVMLGPGMPTLPTIAAYAGTDGPPLPSSMLALVWRSLLAANGAPLERRQLEAWLEAKHWRERL